MNETMEKKRFEKQLNLAYKIRKLDKGVHRHDWRNKCIF